jgi:hypothetical protein
LKPIVIVAMMSLLSGCTIMDRFESSSQHDDRSCQHEFRPLSTQVLGSESAFENALELAAKSSEPTTLGRIADSAGWTGSWDQVIDLYPGITAHDLDQITGLTDWCWHGLPTDNGEGSSDGDYLFLDRGTPVETVTYLHYERFLRFEDQQVIHRDTPLVPAESRNKGGRELRPAPATP